MTIIARLWALLRVWEKHLRLPLIILLLIFGGLMILGQTSQGVIFYSIF
jgi:hypothetical protein